MLLHVIAYAAIAGSTLYPTDSHSDGLAGVTRAAVSVGTGATPSDLADVPVSLDLHSRTWTRAATVGQISGRFRFRLRRQPDGTTVVDQLTLTSQLAGIHIRPETGDMLELSILGSAWDQNVVSVMAPWVQGRVFLPLRLTALGFSDTDADTDRRLKYFAAIGAGAGTDWLVRIYRRVGLQARVEGGGSALYRHRGGMTNQGRLEAWLGGEASVVILDPDLAWLFGGWMAHRTQWELSDDPAGVDRQVISAGIHFGLRAFVRDEDDEPQPDWDDVEEPL